MAIYKNTPPIVTNGLIFYLDASNARSYISSSTVAYSLVPSGSYPRVVSCSLFGGVGYNASNLGSFVFADGDQPGKEFATALSRELPVTTIQLPDGEDVNSMYVKEGSSYFHKKVGTYEV